MQVKVLKYLYLLVCIFIVHPLLAVRATPDTIHVRQPDGSLLAIRLHGDERNHYTTTTDQLMIVRDNDGAYKYAIQGSNGIQAGSITAQNPDKRSTQEQAFTQSIDQKKLLYIKRASVPLKSIGTTTNSQVIPLGKRLISVVKMQISGNNQLSKASSKDTVRMKELVILVNFSDTIFSINNPQQAFYNLFNQSGYNTNDATGSVRDYYYDNSMGKLIFDFTVTAPITLPHPMSYYGANDASGNDLRPADMITDACRLASSSVDFSQYDNDGDGYVDNVFILFAGHNEAEGGSTSSVWPHAWTLNDANISLPSYNGVKINTYACTSELRGNAYSHTMSPIGTFCHEFGHTLGLVDLYDTDYNGTGTEAGGLANWDLMSTGNYNNSGRTPPFLSAISRWILGWCDTSTPAATQTNTLAPIGTSNQVYRIDLPTANEFYLLENRQQNSWDAYLNGHGMLITHIDMTNMTAWQNNKVNADPTHQFADLIEADGNETYSSNGIAGDPYPGTSKKSEFSDTSYPAMGSWYATDKMRQPITDITENNTISFNYCGGPNGSLSAPVANMATLVTDSSFVANWQETDDKDIDYLLDVYYEDYVSNTEDFSAFFTRNNANGWSGNYAVSSITYNSAPCSINLNAKRDTLTSSTFTGVLRSVTFWGKSDGSSTASLRIDGFDGSTWKTIQTGLTLTSLPASYELSTATTPALPNNIVCFRFIYTGTSGNVYIDDIKTSYFGKAYLQGYKNRNAGDNNWAAVSPVVKNKTYYYQIKTQNAILTSPGSNIITVIPVKSRHGVLANAYVNDGNLMIEATDLNNNRVQIYTITGQLIFEKEITKGTYNMGALRSGGVYLVVVNGRGFKLIF